MHYYRAPSHRRCYPGAFDNLDMLDGRYQRDLLRLLHPDFTINQPLKGSKKHARIEAAFKKLSALRDA